IIVWGTKMGLQVIASMLNFVTYLPILHSINKLGGAILGFVEVYLSLFIILYILALTPIAGVQSWIKDSPLALFIVEHTPLHTGKVKTLWLSQMNSLLNV